MLDTRVYDSEMWYDFFLLFECRCFLLLLIEISAHSRNKTIEVLKSCICLFEIVNTNVCFGKYRSNYSWTNRNIKNRNWLFCLKTHILICEKRRNSKETTEKRKQKTQSAKWNISFVLMLTAESERKRTRKAIKEEREMKSKA